MTETALLDNFRSMNVHNLLVENDKVIHHSDGPDLAPENENGQVKEFQCCSLQCSDVTKTSTLKYFVIVVDSESVLLAIWQTVI